MEKDQHAKHRVPDDHCIGCPRETHLQLCLDERGGGQGQPGLNLSFRKQAPQGKKEQERSPTMHQARCSVDGITPGPHPAW